MSAAGPLQSNQPATQRVPAQPEGRRVRDALLAERKRLFVGRKAELARVTTWLRDEAAPTRVISLHGERGIGKSTLLREMLRVAAASGAATLLLDGRACEGTPVGVIEYIGLMLNRGPTSDPGPGGLERLVRSLRLAANTTGRIVLGLDNYDEIAALEGWLREELVGGLSSNRFLLVLASRQGVSLSWLLDPAWRDWIEQFSLSRLSGREAWTYLRRRGVAELWESRAVIGGNRGYHPLELSVAVELLVARRYGSLTGPVSDLSAGAVAGEEATQPAGPSPVTVPPTLDSNLRLTQRESEVAALITRGWSNRQIAAELGIGNRTVGTHVLNILSKLGVHSRAQIAGWAVRRALVEDDADDSRPH